MDALRVSFARVMKRLWLLGSTSRYAVVFMLSLGLSFFAQDASAQFVKTPWPKGKTTPILSFTDVREKKWMPKDLKGRVVILNFWATWCEPCNEKVMVFGVNVNEPVSRALTYLKTHGLALNMVSDPESRWAHQFNVRIYPTTILFDARGQARYTVVGGADWTSNEAKPGSKSKERLPFLMYPVAENEDGRLDSYYSRFL